MLEEPFLEKVFPQPPSQRLSNQVKPRVSADPAVRRMRPHAGLRLIWKFLRVGGIGTMPNPLSGSLKGANTFFQEGFPRIHPRQATAWNLLLGVLQTGQLSGASPTKVSPQTGQT